MAERRVKQQLPDKLTEVPRERWPEDGNPHSKRIRVWVSKHFLVQLFAEANDVLRLSINRCRVNRLGGGWLENISWDELQAIKRDVGFYDRDAVEVYPSDQDVVNVANMRHLWLLPDPLPFAWRRQKYG